MAVVIIRDGERLKTEVDGGTFYYKRIRSTRRAAIIQQYTSRNGNTDFGKATEQILEESLLDWENVVELNGDVVPFDKATIKCLPDTTQTHLMEHVGANVEILESDLKNSQATPDSNS